MPDVRGCQVREKKKDICPHEDRTPIPSPGSLILTHAKTRRREVFQECIITFRQRVLFGQLYPQSFPHLSKRHQCLSAESPVRTASHVQENIPVLVVISAFRQRVLFGLPYVRRLTKFTASHQCLSAESPIRTTMNNMNTTITAASSVPFGRESYSDVASS